MEDSPCAECVPDGNSSSRARARSNRTGCGSGVAFIWVERHQDLPNRTCPRWTGGAWTVLPAASRPVLACAECQRMPGTEGWGTAPHDRTCAHARRRFGRPHSMRRTRDAALPSIIHGDTQRPFPSHNNSQRSTAGPPVFPWVRLPEGDTQPNQPIRSAGCQNSGDEKRWSPARSSTAIANERAVVPWDESRSGSAQTGA